MNKTEGIPAQPKIDKNPYVPIDVKTKPKSATKPTIKPKAKLSIADQDAENIESKGIGLSPTKNFTPKSKMRNSQITTAKGARNAPSLETPQKGYGADNPNPRGETYGDRNFEDTMPDMLDKSTADEYREGPYDRVVKKFVRGMFGR